MLALHRHHHTPSEPIKSDIIFTTNLISRIALFLLVYWDVKYHLQHMKQMSSDLQHQLRMHNLNQLQK